MALIKQPNFTPVSFGSIIDRFFNDNIARAGGSTFVPVVDVSENDQHYEIHVTAPGMKKEDFSIHLDENYLTISGERKFEQEEKGKTWHSIQSHFGQFSRSFYLPDNIAAGKIKASYENGILLISIPKDETKAVKATIKVN